MKRLIRDFLAAFLGAVIALALHSHAEANGRYGGMDPSKINDIEPTVRDVEERVDTVWARKTAADWEFQDYAYCGTHALLSVEINPSARANSYYQRSMWLQRCMYRRLLTRTLYMLRRGCTGVGAIADLCGIPPLPLEEK